MDSNRWARVKQIFAETVEVSSEERDLYLRNTCGDDADLRTQVELLLGAHDSAGSYLETPVLPPAASDPFRPSPGALISHYRLAEFVGGGGMGLVYRAQDLKLARTVALKFLPPEWGRDFKAKQRFLREARAASALDHNNICTVHEVGESEDGQLFIAMAYYDGVTLKGKLSGGALPVEQALDYLIQVAHGLDAAHALGIVHRDIKPANVMVTSSGIIKILDFGLAMFSGQTRLTRTGTTIGTIAYMAPEQLRQKPIDHRVDLWSLGVLFYELLTGRLAFEGRHDQAIIYAILNDEPRPVEVSDRGLAARLNAVLDQALSKDRARRYASATEMLVDLHAVRGRVSTRTVAARSDVPVALARRRRRLWMSLGVVLFLVAALVGYSIWARGHPEPLGQPQLSAQAVKPTIAVLLFQNMTGDEDLDWLGSGLAEMMVTDLAQSTDVEVISTQRIFELSRGFESSASIMAESEILEIIQETSADIALVGSYLRDGESYRLTTHVRDAAGQRLASETVDSSVSTSLFSLVDELTHRVRSTMGLVEETSSLHRELREMLTDSTEAFRLYSEAVRLHYVGQPLHAIPLLEAAVKVDPEFAAALSKLSLLHSNAGHDQEALEYSRRAFESSARLSERERDYVEGNHYILLEETYGRAMAAYSRAVERFPDHWPARNNLGMIYLEMGLYDQAATQFEVLRQGLPDRLSLAWKLVLCYHALGREDRSEAIVNEALSRSSDDYRAWKIKGDWAVLQGDGSGARKAFVGVQDRALDGLDLSDRTWKADVLEERWEALGAWLGREFVVDSYDDAPGALDRALASLYLGRSAEALEYFEQALAVYPQAGRTSGAVRSVMAYVHLERGDPVLAAAEARRAQSEGRGDVGEWAGLFYEAVALARQERLEEAEGRAVALTERVRTLPSDREERRVNHLRGLLALERGDTESAITHLESAEAMLSPRGIVWAKPLPPDHVPIWYALASAHLEAGDPAAAAEWLLRVVESGGERFEWPILYVRSLGMLADIFEALEDQSASERLRGRSLSHWMSGDLDRGRVAGASG